MKLLRIYLTTAETLSYEIESEDHVLASEDILLIFGENNEYRVQDTDERQIRTKIRTEKVETRVRMAFVVYWEIVHQ